MICTRCGHYTHPDREMDLAQGSGECRCGCHPWMPPERHRDLTPAMDQQRCLCGVRFPRHFDGWDGNRLDCAEALRRHGTA